MSPNVCVELTAILAHDLQVLKASTKLDWIGLDWIGHPALQLGTEVEFLLAIVIFGPV